MIFRLAAFALALIAPVAAHAEWYEASTEHFVVYADNRPEVVMKFANELERFDKALRLFRNLPDQATGDANRVTVYVVPSLNTVQRLARSDNVAGFYRGRAGGSMAIVPRITDASDPTDLSARAVLLHEYTHHMMLSLWPHAAYPTWFVEGFAEFHATSRIEKDGAVSFGHAPLYRAYGLLIGNVLPIEKLMVADSLKLNDFQRDGLYGRGWLLTHYLTISPERQAQLGAYLIAINSGKRPLDAAIAAFGDLRKLDRELERYKLGKLQGWQVPPDRIAVKPVRMRKLTAGEAATMDVRITSKNGVSKKTAPGVYAKAVKAAAPFANDPGAQVVLAETAYDAEDYAVAEAAADRAIAADPKAIDAYVYKAMVRMALATKANDRAPATWSAIRKIIATANRIDPNDPEPLMLFYRSFIDGGQVPSVNARRGIYRAFELGPQDETLRLIAVAAYLHDNNPGMARELLKPLAYDPHGKGLAKLAGELIAAIDAGKLAEAQEILKRPPPQEEKES